ncbi:MAG: protoheme IX farnesyltransferase [Proteobacteria bacterium]|nr:MAG: protoheme IX farnesyltransferase [Pseudomonadota bacterium]
MAAQVSLALPHAPSFRDRFRDLVALAKPRITLFVLMTAGGGMYLGRRAEGVPLNAMTATLALLGIALVVSGANALNMVIERDIDKNMARTKNRPLPSGRMHVRTALVFGVATTVISVPVLLLGTNILTTFLAVLANLLYVLAYTPLKQRSHHSLLVGAVPGAIPPLLGWTATTNRLDAAGFTLFAILFLWQVPHFLAIALFRRNDYARAGLFVMPNVRSISQVKHSIASYTLALVLVSLLLVPLGVTGGIYLIGASAFGCAFLGAALLGFGVSDKDVKWPRSLFLASLLYLVALVGTLVADVALS